MNTAPCFTFLQLDNLSHYEQSIDGEDRDLETLSNCTHQVILPPYMEVPQARGDEMGIAYANVIFYILQNFYLLYLQCRFPLNSYGESLRTHFSLTTYLKDFEIDEMLSKTNILSKCILLSLFFYLKNNEYLKIINTIN